MKLKCSSAKALNFSWKPLIDLILVVFVAHSSQYSKDVFATFNEIH